MQLFLNKVRTFTVFLCIQVTLAIVVNQATKGLHRRYQIQELKKLMGIKAKSDT